MTSPYEYLQIPPDAAADAARMSGVALGSYMDAWLPDGNPAGTRAGLAEFLARGDSMDTHTIEDPRRRANHLEFAQRIAKLLVGPEARIVVGEPDGQ